MTNRQQIIDDSLDEFSKHLDPFELALCARVGIGIGKETVRLIMDSPLPDKSRRRAVEAALAGTLASLRRAAGEMK